MIHNNINVAIQKIWKECFFILSNDSKAATEKDYREVLKECEEKWTNEISGEEIIQEGIVRVAITKEGEAITMLGITPRMCTELVVTLAENDPVAFYQGIMKHNARAMESMIMGKNSEASEESTSEIDDTLE